MRGRDVFQRLMIGLGTLALAALYAGIWYWGYTGSEAVPLEVQQPILAVLASVLVSLASGTLIYGLTLRTLRRNPGSRLLGWVWLLIPLFRRLPSPSSLDQVGPEYRARCC